jgi:serine protease AprX
MPNVSLAALSASTAVSHLALDRIVVGALERTGPTTGATFARQQFGLDGSGVGVAVIDSGVAAAHDDLADPSSGAPRVAAFVDFVNNAPAPYDDYGHGTHVAGIVAGNGFDSNGARSGIAPAARLISLKVLDGSGQGHISDVVAAFDYAVAHRADFNIRVINLSVASGVYESYDSDPLPQAALRAVQAGIVVVASAGNAGRDQNGNTQYGRVTAPGNAPWVLTVGASSHMGTIDRSDDTIAAFSSRGPTAVDRTAKPDLVAPGVGIESLAAPSSTLYTSDAAYLLPGTTQTAYEPYLSLSGTSQAAPVVAGTVALMLEANPALTPNAVKAVLQFTAQVYDGYDALTQGAGFLNAAGAVSLARFLSVPSALPSPDTTGWSMRVIWGTHVVRGGQLTPDASAWATNLSWGSTTTAAGQPVAWGLFCSANCGSGAAQWQTWEVPCADVACQSVDWSSINSYDIVTGAGCNGNASCPSGTAWSTNDQSGTTVWATSDSGDTVVWGTSCTDPSCTPVIWRGQ